MRPVARPRAFLIALVVLAALACLLLSLLPFPEVKAFIDASSADGDVESYDAAFHERLQHRSIIVALMLFLVAAGFVFFRARVDRAIARSERDAHGFLSDARASWHRLRTSVGRVEALGVAALLIIAAILRGSMLNEPVIYDEAFTCTYYAVRPLPIIVSDYSYPNNHILHTLLVKGSLWLFGWGEVQARLPAFIAGMVALVLCWVWVRAAFGRGVAFMTLGLCIVSGPLIEYAALARGYSITWVCLLISLLLVRHLLRSGNGFTAALLALVNALGMWTVPTMIYSSAMIYVLAFVSLPGVGRPFTRSRLVLTLLSGALFIVLTLLLYAPVLMTYGPGRLIAHDALAPQVWSLTTVGTWWIIAGAVVLAIISSRSYRQLIVATSIALLPLVFLRDLIGPARVWSFLPFILLPAVPLAIKEAVERLQRFVRTSDRVRALIFGSTSLLAFALAVPRALPDNIQRYSGAREAAVWSARHLEATDRVLVNFPYEAPTEFYFRKYDLGIQPLYRAPVEGGRLWFITGEGDGQTFEALAARARLLQGSWSDPRPVRDLDRMAIFAARYR